MFQLNLVYDNKNYDGKDGGRGQEGEGGERPRCAEEGLRGAGQAQRRRLPFVAARFPSIDFHSSIQLISPPPRAPAAPAPALAAWASKLASLASLLSTAYAYASYGFWMESNFYDDERGREE